LNGPVAVVHLADGSFLLSTVIRWITGMIDDPLVPASRPPDTLGQKFADYQQQAETALDPIALSNSAEHSGSNLAADSDHDTLLPIIWVAFRIVPGFRNNAAF
jgi:hypothetical protein